MLTLHLLLHHCVDCPANSFKKTTKKKKVAIQINLDVGSSVYAAPQRVQVRGSTPRFSLAQEIDQHSAQGLLSRNGMHQQDFFPHKNTPPLPRSFVAASAPCLLLCDRSNALM